jgi:hypothetical protein
MVVSEFHTGSGVARLQQQRQQQTNQSKTHVHTIGRYTHSDRSQYEIAMVGYFLLHGGWKQKRKVSVIYLNEVSNINIYRQPPTSTTSTTTQTRTANEQRFCVLSSLPTMPLTPRDS